MALAIARRLGRDHRLLIADRDVARLEEVQALLRSEGLDVAVARCDVTHDRDVLAFARAAHEAGPVRALAHVVGLSPSMADADTILSVNLGGARRIADAFLPVLDHGGCGLFISSMAGHRADTDAAMDAVLDNPELIDIALPLRALLGEDLTPNRAYGLSKAALNRMCRRLATAWGARGLRIVSLSPGLIASPMGALEFQRQPMKQDLLAATPAGREGTMGEVAEAAAFLLSPAAAFISGTDLLIDGGLVAALTRRDAPRR